MNPPPHYGLDDFSRWFQGVFNIQPVTRKNVRYLAEYLWLIDHRSTYGARVMSSFSHDKGKEITHTMYELRKGLEDQDFERSVNRRPDPTRRRELAHVTLVRLDYHVNKKSGEILLDSRAIRTIDVRNNPPEILAK